MMRLKLTASQALGRTKLVLPIAFFARFLRVRIEADLA